MAASARLRDPRSGSSEARWPVEAAGPASALRSRPGPPRGQLTTNHARRSWCAGRGRDRAGGNDADGAVSVEPELDRDPRCQPREGHCGRVEDRVTVPAHPPAVAGCKVEDMRFAAPVALDRQTPPGERAVEGGGDDDGAARVNPRPAAARARGREPDRRPAVRLKRLRLREANCRPGARDVPSRES